MAGETLDRTLAQELEDELLFIRDHKDQQPGEEWYFISAAWMKTWRRYATSVETHAPSPHPGAISNWHLLDQGKQYAEIIPDLDPAQYQCVTKAVWQRLQEKYHGGPAIAKPDDRQIGGAAVVDSGIAKAVRKASPSRAATRRISGRLQVTAGLGDLSRSTTSFPQSITEDVVANDNAKVVRNAAALKEELEFIENNDVPRGGDKWHIISATWLRTWRKYVAKEGNGPHPGPISNVELLDENLDLHVPKLDLVAGKHYRGISPAAWNRLQETYGGGPCITSVDLNIYVFDAVVYPEAPAPTVSTSLGLESENFSPSRNLRPMRTGGADSSEELQRKHRMDAPSGTGSLSTSASTPRSSPTSSSSSFLWSFGKKIGPLRRITSALTQRTTFEV